MVRRSLVAAVLLIVAISLLSLLRLRDISGSIFGLETKIVGVLESHGVVPGKILSRNEESWRRNRIRGKTIRYTVDGAGIRSIPDLASRIKEEVKTFHRDIKVLEISYAGGADRYKSAVLDVAYGNNVVLSLEFVYRKYREDKKPLIAFVLDDFGYSTKNLAVLGSIGIPITLAVLPDTPYAEKVCSFASEKGFEVILHMPMEPLDGNIALESSTLKVGMPAEAVRVNINNALCRVPSACGMNNHMGSKATGNRELMETVFSELFARNMYFLDSFTIKETVCGELAVEKKVPYARRDLFIDNRADKEYIAGEIVKAADMARDNGYVIAIGHDRPLTMSALSEKIPKLESEGMEFVTLSELFRRVPGLKEEAVRSKGDD